MPPVNPGRETQTAAEPVEPITPPSTHTTRKPMAPAALRRVAAVTAYELRLEARASGPKVLLVLLALLAGGAALTRWGSPLDGYAAALIVGQGITLFALVLLPFLLAPTFARDARRRVSALLWVRPLAPAEYALGKALAVTLTAIAITLPALVVGWVCASVSLGAVQPVAWWLAVALIVLVGIVSGVCFTLLLIAIAPRPMLGAITSALILLYFALLSPQTLLQPTNLAARTVYASSILGFGPDISLLIAQRLADLGVGVSLLAAFCAIMQLRERRGAPRPGHWLSVVISCVVTAAFMVGALANFSSVADSHATLGPIPKAPAPATSSGYRLSVTLDPDSGSLDGVAIFVLTPERAGQHTVQLALNPGLRISAISRTTAGDGAPIVTPVTFQSRLGWTTLQLDNTPFVEGAPIQLTIMYGGHLAMDRDDYAQVSPGLSLGTTPSGGMSPAPITAYVGQGVAYLQGDGYGNWYPLPWTTQIQGIYVAWQPIADAQVRVPTNNTLLCSAATGMTGVTGLTSLSADGRWQEFSLRDWNAPLPQAFCAVLKAPQQRVIAGGSHLFTPKGYMNSPDGTAHQVDAQMLQQAADLQAWLQPARSGTPWTGVVAPLIQYPVVGDGLILLPEAPISETVNYGGYAVGTALGDYRSSAQQVSFAWWLNAIRFRNSGTGYVSMAPSLQTPRGRALFNSGMPQLLFLLNNYTAAALTGRAYGQRVFQQEMAQEQAAFNASPSPRPELSLFHLEQQIGSAKTTLLLQGFVTQFVTKPAGIQEYLAAGSAAAGHDFSTVAAPYLSSESD